MKYIHIILAVAASASLAACGAGSVGPPSFTTANPSNIGKLQLAVGTANIAGTPGLNVVSTFRQANGMSAVGANTPTITGPFTLPAPVADSGGGFDPYSTLPSGPSAQEVAAKAIMGTPQTVRPGTPVCDQTTPCAEPSSAPVAPNTTTLGQSGGVFGMGLQPANSTINTTATSYVPYSEPLYDTAGIGFQPFGGPPAFDPDKNGMGTRDGEWNLGAQVLGMQTGLTSFEGVTPAAGTYTMSVVVSTQGTNGSVNNYPYTASATLSNTTLLGNATAPALTFDGNGGASMTIGSLPSGVTEAYVWIIDWGPSGTAGKSAANCQGPIGTTAFPVYYTLHITAAGTYTLPDTDGPNNNFTGKGGPTATPSICTAAQNSAAGDGAAGDTVTTYFVGFDYPAYGITYVNSSGNQTPTLTGANGQADITISAPSAAQTSP